MKYFAILLIGILFSFKKDTTLYSYKVKDITGKTFKLSSLKGKKIMIVNTASECGYTPQYEQLQQLYEAFKNKNFVVIGFPSNNFGAQEPGKDAEIETFCKKNYGVTFPMMSKISVKGEDQAPIYNYLTSKSLNGVLDSEVKWNFQKYLIDENGVLVRMLPSKTSPMDQEVIDWIMDGETE